MAEDISIRPWPGKDRDPKNIREFIARVNTEYGGFRNIKQEDLRKDAEAKKNGAVGSTEAEDVEMSDGDGDGSDGDETEDKPRDSLRAREEGLRSVNEAARTASSAVALISLLLTKELPVQAANTLPPWVRESTGIGTLGASRLARPKSTEEKRKDNQLVATGAKLREISDSLDTVVAAASRLQKEITRETKYWADVLAVSESGWTVSRMPREQWTLGVTFGFLESAPQFRGNSIAPMRREDDGAIRLDNPMLQQNPERLQVVMERYGEVIGVSSLPIPASNNAPLNERVLEARNTMFTQELWHELNREARSLLSYDVRLEDSSIVIQMEPDTTMKLHLVTPGESNIVTSTRPRDTDCETVSSLLTLLLSHAHRQNNRRRCQPNPAKTAVGGRATPAYQLLRPILARFRHEQSMASTVSFLAQVTSTLRAAGIRTAGFKLTELALTPRLPAPAAAAARTSRSEALVNAVFAPYEFNFELALTPEARVLINGRTIQVPYIGTQYMVQPLRADPTRVAAAAAAAAATSSSAGLAALAENPLFEPSSALAAADRTVYPDFDGVVSYLRGVVARLLAEHAMVLAEDLSDAARRRESKLARHTPAKEDEVRDDADDHRRTDGGGSGGGGTAAIEWAMSVSGTSIRDIDSRNVEVQFQLAFAGEDDAESAVVRLGDGGPLELRLVLARRVDEALRAKQFVWGAEDAPAQQQQPQQQEEALAVVLKRFLNEVINSQVLS